MAPAPRLVVSDAKPVTGVIDMKNAVSLALVLNAILTTHAWSADVAAGERVAQAYCARCHDISAKPRADMVNRTAGPPALAGVIKARGLDGDKVRRLLRLPHGEMNTVMLADRDIDDVIAFIMSRQPQ